MPPAHRGGPTPGARILLLDPCDRALLLCVCDPTQPSRSWWELPGGSAKTGERLEAAACRELAEETGIHLSCDLLQGCVALREARYHWQGRDHHRHEEIHLARLPADLTSYPHRRDALERQTILDQRWWSLPELTETTQTFLPAALPDLLAQVLSGMDPGAPVVLREDTRDQSGAPRR